MPTHLALQCTYAQTASHPNAIYVFKATIAANLGDKDLLFDKVSPELVVVVERTSPTATQPCRLTEFRADYSALTALAAPSNPFIEANALQSQ